MGGPAGVVDEPMLEDYTTLGFVAGITRRVQPHLLVTGASSRRWWSSRGAAEAV